MVGWLAGWLACLLVKLSWFCMCRSCNASKHTVNKFIICWMKQATNKKNNNSNTTNSSSSSKKKYEKTTINYPAIQTQTHTPYILFLHFYQSLCSLIFMFNKPMKKIWLFNESKRTREKKERTAKSYENFYSIFFLYPPFTLLLSLPLG